MQIGIMGCGVVGGALANALETLKFGGDILLYDPAKYETQPSELATCSIVFVCVPSPMRPDGSQDDSIVRASMRMLVGVDFKGIVVIKSTLLPTKLLEIKELFDLPLVSNPEFLTERTANEDCLNAEFHIVGSDDEHARCTVARLYKKYWPNALVYSTSLLAGMMIKYVINTHLTLKVAFMNEIYFMWKALSGGAPWSDITNGLKLDIRMGGTHTVVPGPDGDFGFGGKCFPKDLNALIKLAELFSVEPFTLKAAWESNKVVRKNKDWLNIPGATSE